MSSVVLAPGHTFLRSVVEALGLGDRSVRRVVLDIKIGDIVRAYVEEQVGCERMANLVGEIPSVEPLVQWCDRVKVDNAEGSAIQIKALAAQDTRARVLLLALARRLEDASPQEIREITAFLMGEPEAEEKG